MVFVAVVEHEQPIRCLFARVGGSEVLHRTGARPFPSSAVFGFAVIGAGLALVAARRSRSCRLHFVCDNEGAAGCVEVCTVHPHRRIPRRRFLTGLAGTAAARNPARVLVRPGAPVASPADWLSASIGPRPWRIGRVPRTEFAAFANGIARVSETADASVIRSGDALVMP